MNFPRSIWNWLRRQVVYDVPQSDALCEFDCRKPQCTDSEWEVCERRLHRGAGELMPEEKPVAEAAAPAAKSVPTPSTPQSSK
jgi:hypothetical protein